MMGKWYVSRDYRECFFYLRKRGVKTLLKIQPDVILIIDPPYYCFFTILSLHVSYLCQPEFSFFVFFFFF